MGGGGAHRKTTFVWFFRFDLDSILVPFFHFLLR